MIVRLNTSWTADPEKWADAAGMAPARCLPELPWYISDAICFLPMLDATDARLRHPGGEMDLPAELDGLVRFTMNWTIHVDADTWIRTRAKGSGHRPQKTAALPRPFQHPTGGLIPIAHSTSPKSCTTCPWSSSPAQP
ncbi:hypothetical protein AB8O64_02875 [Streptomyces sp. QH1-20]|uniref:hypothetical protein n=1 Tax=Streptomyces sp. QH1-20 TaxID=3240934 RepID=UPI0035199F31